MTTDADHLAIASEWLDEGRALAAKEDAFAGCVEYLQIQP